MNTERAPAEERIEDAERSAETMPVQVKSRLPRWVWIVSIGCPLLVAVSLWWFGDRDHAIGHMVSFAVTTVSVIVLGSWFLLCSDCQRSLRLGAGGVFLLGCILMVLLVRLDGVTGELMPRLRFRWSSSGTLNEPKQQVVDLLTTTAHDFPQFLGPQRNAALENLNLNPDWQDQPPQKLWSQRIGRGWSGFAAVNGYAVTMEQRDDEEWVTCYEIATGKLCWKHTVSARHETFLGGVGPRSTPTIDDGNVYALGATGILRCLAGENGRLLWQRDLLKLAGTDLAADLKAVSWGRSASPLLVDDQVVVPLGGPPAGSKTSLIAFDKQTGRTLWRAGDRQVSYSSPTLMTLARRRQIVIVNEDNVSGHDVQTGQVLWEYAWAGQSNAAASVSQPVALSEDRLLLSKGYQQGAVVLDIKSADSDSASSPYVATFNWGNPSVLKTKFTNVAQREGFLYGLSDGILECVAAVDGSRQWKRGRYGHGQLLRVGQRLLLLSEKGMLHLIALSPQGLQEQGEMKVMKQQCWATLCLYGNQLLVRSVDEIACYQLPLQTELPASVP